MFSLKNEYKRMLSDEKISKELFAHNGDVNKVIWHDIEDDLPPKGEVYTLIFKDSKNDIKYCTGTYTHDFCGDDWKEPKFASDYTCVYIPNAKYWGFWDRVQYGTCFDGKWWNNKGSREYWENKYGLVD